jgi:hypothetical protein
VCHNAKNVTHRDIMVLQRLNHRRHELPYSFVWHYHLTNVVAVLLLDAEECMAASEAA